ncbi:hypothetical protein CDAR_218301 [Caerostris darwini]|uniref:Uncharacterized protein n=1 Tax=Caerostris darwini TaxID=1538125 RepID=A0AAV4R721_9ARAC|nr:hypothetical protein CDAR_218301 [Caerostris darwini]
MVKQRDGDGMCAMLNREEKENGEIIVDSNSVLSFLEIFSSGLNFRYSSSLDYVHRMVKRREGGGMYAMLNRKKEENGEVIFGSNSVLSFPETFSSGLVSLLLECMTRNKMKGKHKNVEC